MGTPSHAPWSPRARGPGRTLATPTALRGQVRTAPREPRREPFDDDGGANARSPRCGRPAWHHSGVTSPASTSAPAHPHESPRPPRWWGRALLMAVAAVFFAIFAWYAGGALLGLFASIVIAFFLALAFEPSVLWLVR